MERRLVIAGLGIATILCTFPLFHLLKQEYLPTNVDEGEFEMSVNAPEGASLDSMKQALTRIENNLRDLPGINQTPAPRYKQSRTMSYGRA